MFFVLCRTKTASTGVMASPSWPNPSYRSYCSWKLDRSSSNGYLIHVMDIKDQSISSYCYSNEQQIEIKGKFPIQTSVKCVCEIEANLLNRLIGIKDLDCLE